MKQYTLICKHTGWSLDTFTSLRELNLEYSPTVREGLRREGFELKCHNLTPIEYIRSNVYIDSMVDTVCF